MQIQKFDPDTTYRQKGKGGGLENAFKRLIAIRPSTWKLYSKVFKVIIGGAKYADKPIIGPIYKFIMMFSPEEKRFTQGVALNLNIDLTDNTINTVLPIDLMKKTVREASYIASFTSCICRTNNECSDYPVDFGCIFIGEAAKGLVKNQVAIEISPELAEARIDKAAELGLVGQSLWVEVEQYLWGIQNEHMEKFLELCFCCPCCCTAFNVAKNSTPEIRARFKSVGWGAEINENCIVCGSCIEICPQRAITMDGESIVIDEQCIGCGLCKYKCIADAINLVPKEELFKNDIKEYYSGLKLEL